MDFSVVIGLIVSFGALIVGYLLEHGIIASLFLLSPFIIVFGGTVGVIILSFGFHDTINAAKSLFQSYFTKNLPNPEFLIEKICIMADACRKDGLLKLQTMLDDQDINNDNYILLKEGMILALDMKPADQIQAVLDTDLHVYSEKKQTEIEVFEGAGGFSPTLGIIGTVMGLVQVLSHMDTPEKLTASIAVAFIATLYGVVFANLLYLPAANRLKNVLKQQKMFREMIINGICMIASGESSRNIENQLSLYYQAFPGKEKKYKDGIGK